MYSRRKQKKKASENTARLNIALAVVFLLAGILIYKLFQLQIVNADYYAALASDQHAVFNKLEPERGEIFIQDNQSGKGQLYPIAVNKEFAYVYAVPKKVTESKKIAEDLYALFDAKRIEKEVDALLEDDDFFLELFEEQENDEGGSSFQLRSGMKESEKFKFFEIKKELEIKTRKTEVIDAYLAKLEKKNDPFEPLQKKVDEEELKILMSKKYEGIDYMMQRNRYYPEKELGAHFLGFVGYVGDKASGRYGLEGFFDEELAGKQGSVKAGRSAAGDIIIMNDREFEKPLDGSDLSLTINRSIQFEACLQLEKAVKTYDAQGGTVIVMNPFSGAILAMCSVPSYDPNKYNQVENINVYNNPAIFDAYEPGSIFKVFTMAAGLNEGVISPNSIYEDKGFVYVEGWKKPIKNSDFESKGAHGWVDMVTVLEESLNTGTIFIETKVGSKKFAKYVKDFGFGEKSGIELETEGLSNIVNLERNRIRPVEAATASFGQGITATPLQMISAYAAIANGGILMKPYLVDEIVNSLGERDKTTPQQIRRVITEKSAVLLSGMMVNVIEGGHAKHAAVPGYYVAGKTGTAQVADKEKGGYLEDQTIHSFVGFAPVEEPKFVMLVKLEAPKNSEYSAGSAAPLFGEIADFILNYYKVPKER